MIVYTYSLLLIIETGLADRWVDMYLLTPFQCMVDPSSRQAKLADIRNPALVFLLGLVPASLFLLFGFILACNCSIIRMDQKLMHRQFNYFVIFSSLHLTNE